MKKIENDRRHRHRPRQYKDINNIKGYGSAQDLPDEVFVQDQETFTFGEVIGEEADRRHRK